MKAGRTLRSLGEGGGGSGFREFRKIPRSLLRGASLARVRRHEGTAIPFLTRVLKLEASPSKNAKSRLPLDPWETDKPMG